MEIINTLNIVGSLAICGLAGEKKGRTMNPLIQLKQITSVFLIAFGLACFGLSPAARAVSPPPDGGYPGENTAEGDFALFSLSTGQNNTAIGFGALASNTTSGSNTAIGDLALWHNTTGPGFNTAVGVAALFENAAGSYNSAIGYQALYSNTTGCYNTAIGFQALYSMIMDGYPSAGTTAIGYQALYHTTVDRSTAIGNQALYKNTTGTGNTATGFEALYHNTIGYDNTATGDWALHDNTRGHGNVAIGNNALDTNTTNNDNTAIGEAALAFHGSGNSNTAIGNGALFFNDSGGSNIALGTQAGQNLTTGSNNIYIGNNGRATETGHIRIGMEGTQNATNIAGIYGTAVANSATVVINSNGQLGTLVSSARFKEAIKRMDKASEAILALKPVTFRYKQDIDPDGVPQFGLVAEDVEKVNPDLVARDQEGKPYTVRYEAVNAMLLNEFLKAHGKVEKLETTVTRQQKQIETLTAGLQKVSARLESRASSTRVVANN